jgi:hypothetical protein
MIPTLKPLEDEALNEAKAEVLNPVNFLFLSKSNFNDKHWKKQFDLFLN